MSKKTGVSPNMVGLLLLIFIFANGYLILQKEISLSRYFLIISAMVYAVFLTKKINAGIENHSSEFSEVQDNVREAQRIIHQKSYGIFRYIARGDLVGTDQIARLNLTEIIESPIIWIFCFLVAVILYLNPIYLELDTPQSLLKLFLLSGLQFILFSVSFSGVFLSLAKLSKGKNK
ncbi:MAG: hypothetical protein M0P39_09700 [Rhodocyclaceae bacterium]|jgi:hypothetical protein|nr:hypothetical protein [Rhodocyclaceae bacterium]